MSQVDIYTDLILRTAQFTGPLKEASGQLQAEVRRWANTEIDIETRFTLPDTAVVREILGQLRAESVDIPVRYVVQGQPPTAPPAAPSSTNYPSGGYQPTAGRFGSNTAGNVGSSVALSNGRPGVDAIGIGGGGVQTYSRPIEPVAAAAHQTVNEHDDLGPTIERFKAEVTDLTSELSDLALAFARFNVDGRNRSIQTLIDSGEPDPDAKQSRRRNRRRPTAFDLDDADAVTAHSTAPTQTAPAPPSAATAPASTPAATTVTPAPVSAAAYAPGGPGQASAAATATTAFDAALASLVVTLQAATTATAQAAAQAGTAPSSQQPASSPAGSSTAQGPVYGPNPKPKGWRTPAAQASRNAQAAQIRSQRGLAMQSYVRTGGGNGSNGYTGAGFANGYNHAPLVKGKRRYTQGAPKRRQSGSTTPAGNGNKGIGRFGPAQIYRALQFGAGAYVADRAMRTVTNIGDSDVGLSGNQANYARMNALNQTIDSVPVVGAATNLATSIYNYSTGRGFHSDAALNEQTVRLAGYQDQTGRANIASRAAANAARTYDTRDLAEQRRHTEKTQLDAELNDPANDEKYWRTYTDTRGREHHELNSNGSSRKAAETGRIDAEADRTIKDDRLKNAAEDAGSAVSVQQSKREGAAAADHANLHYGRDRELQDTIAGIDEGVARQRAAAKPVLDNQQADPRERARVQQELDAGEVKATADKAAAKTEATRKAALEDSQIIADTQEATLRASGDTWAAETRQFEEQWRQRLSAEQDANRRILLERQKTAEETERQYHLVEQARHTNQQNRVSEENTAGKHETAQKDQADIQFHEQALAGSLLDKNGNLKGADDKTLNDGQRKLRESLLRQHADAYAEIEKHQRYGTEDIQRDADQREGHLAGNDYGAQLKDIEARRKRQIDENQDLTLEGMDRRKQINRQFDAEKAQADRDHKDEIRRNNLSGSQAFLRSQGRGREAEAAGEVHDIAEELRSARGDPEKLKSVVAKRQGELREQAMGEQHAEMFGSVAEYANKMFLGQANSGGGAAAYQQLQQAAIELNKINWHDPASKIAEAADKIISKFNAI